VILFAEPPPSALRAHAEMIRGSNKLGVRNIGLLGSGLDQRARKSVERNSNKADCPAAAL
jgi:hypothetical protein